MCVILHENMNVEPYNMSLYTIFIAQDEIVYFTKTLIPQNECKLVLIDQITLMQVSDPDLIHNSTTSMLHVSCLRVVDQIGHSAHPKKTIKALHPYMLRARGIVDWMGRSAQTVITFKTKLESGEVYHPNINAM